MRSVRSSALAAILPAITAINQSKMLHFGRKLFGQIFIAIFLDEFSPQKTDRNLPEYLLWTRILECMVFESNAR
jgi:hypothetical protein